MNGPHRELGSTLLRALGPVLLGLALLAPATGAAAGPRDQPNLIVVTTDDQTLEAMNEETMPFTSSFFAKQGTTFNNAVVVSPSCCPSRAAFITGQYPHNNGVFSNFPGYQALKQKNNTLPVWLDQAGYRTAHVGKFLNRYGESDGWKTPAPGFDEWFTLTTYKYYDYKIGSNGRLRRYGTADRDYLTRRLNGRANRFVAKQAGKDRPFYLQLDQFAPHSEVSSTENRCQDAAQPDPRDVDLFTDTPLPQDSLPEDERSFSEADTSDKSPVMAGMRRLSDFILDKIRTRYRCQLAALRGVDRGMEQLHRTLAKKGLLRKTALVFTSDNGFFHGEHRLPNNKGFPYEEGIRVPLMIRLPPSMVSDPPTERDEPVSNIDITATLVHLAQTTSCRKNGNCRQLDGRSLMRMLTGKVPQWPENRRILVEQGRGQFFCAAYSALWSPEELLIEYPTEQEDGGCRPEREYYETADDPLQLENLFPADPGTQRSNHQREMIDRLHRTTRCSGIEGRDPARGGRPFCE